MIKNSIWQHRFMGSKEKYREGKIIMVGAPMDYSVSYRPGTRYGPQKIREVSYVLEEYSPYINRELSEIEFFDYGDIELPFGNIEESLKIIYNATLEILGDNKKPLFIGGEHLITLPIVKGIFERYGDDLILLHFDAHADLRESYLGQKHSHASVIRRILDFLPANNVYQMGIRSGTKEEFKYGRKYTHLFLYDVVEPVKSILNKIYGKPIYITLDIDVFDPAFADGTGTPEPGGCTPHDMLKVIQLLKDQNVVGFDLVEVSPVYDTSDKTAILAAKMIRESLLSFL
ncbi:MAG TPA: agmatinase [Clostridiales bacterium]|nr:agmatinase [Clostridiales bacterium]